MPYLPEEAMESFRTHHGMSTGTMLANVWTWLNGRKTASGQVYNRDQLTAAHKTLPFGTQVKVTNTKNAKSVVVQINDRGPTQADRVLDLSPKAASALGIKSKGMAEVSLEVVGEAPAKAAKK